jgi:hypothetical protein
LIVTNVKAITRTAAASTSNWPAPVAWLIRSPKPKAV